MGLLVDEGAGRPPVPVGLAVAGVLGTGTGLGLGLAVPMGSAVVRTGTGTTTTSVPEGPDEVMPTWGTVAVTGTTVVVVEGSPAGPVQSTTWVLVTMTVV